MSPCGDDRAHLALASQEQESRDRSGELVGHKAALFSEKLQGCLGAHEQGQQGELHEGHGCEQ